jgi:DNA-binding transcriptional regulator YiaG
MPEKSGLNTMNTTTQPYLSTIPIAINKKTSTALGLFLPLLLTPGSGGSITPHSIEKLERYYSHSIIHVEHSTAKNVDTRSSAEHVANIRDVLAINMSELASILRSTRPTVYAWLEGRQEPKAEAAVNIRRLSHVADRIKLANVIQLDQLIRRPVVNGRSLLDIIKVNDDPSDILQVLKSISEKEAKTRSESKITGKKLRSLDDVSSEFSVAIHERS